MTLTLYTDGGVIQRNPSPIAGTWAFVLVAENGSIEKNSGVILPSEWGLTEITNNQTEMYAMLMGLCAVSESEEGVVVCPDSMVTLGRCFLGYRWKNIPPAMHEIYQRERKRLDRYWSTYKTILLAGHPTRAQLATGFGKHGYPVSEYNVMCDQMCREAGEKYLAEQEGYCENTGKPRADCGCSDCYRHFVGSA